MIKNLFLVFLLICCCNCSVHEVESEPIAEHKPIKFLCRASTSATKNTPLYVAHLNNKFYKLNDRLIEEIPPSGISKVQVLEREKALEKYDTKASNGVIELEYKPEFQKQLLAKKLEELNVTL
ncbi:hypothetical protein [Leeuwenhoekiella marinoflava]|uniref:hypothetical protein n=1 Tax=Leeuwenhoekiella marinoflava TaxID=988 RepID=UPI003002D6C9